MPYVPFEARQPVELQRRLSLSEYYHAAIGQHPQSALPAREIVFILEGQGGLDLQALRQAVAHVAVVHPACRLRLRGQGLRACWRSDGQLPQVIDGGDSSWSADGDEGAPDFSLRPLEVRRGICAELVYYRLPQGHCRLMVRVAHAVSDGRGVLFWLADIFRVLRQEPPLGVNAVYPDSRLKHQRGGRPAPAGPAAQPLVPRRPGGASCWRSFQLPAPQAALLARLAAALGRFCAGYRPGGVKLALAVDLRRHADDLRASHHLSGMLHLRVDPDDTPTQIRARIEQALQQGQEAVWRPWHELFRCLPMALIDGLLSPRRDRQTPPPLLETVVVSNLGRIDPRLYACEGFQAHRLSGIPVPGNAFIFLFGFGEQVEVVCGLPADMAWAMSAWMADLQAALLQA